MSDIVSAIEYLSSVEEVSMHDGWFDIATEDHFWLKWRMEVVKKFADYLPIKGGKILEIGCGNGIVLSQLSKLGYQIDGCDLNEHALKMIERHHGRVLLYNIFDRNPELLGKYDCVFLLDVVEHIEDHLAFVKMASDYLVEGGTMIINVPAGSFLYGPYDKEVGHVRRYSMKQLEELFHSCGLQEIKSKYWAFSLIPFALARKLLHQFKNKKIIESGMKPPGKLAHKFLEWIMKLELAFIKSPKFGASVMAAGRKLNNSHS